LQDNSLVQTQKTPAMLAVSRRISVKMNDNNSTNVEQSIEHETHQHVAAKECRVALSPIKVETLSNILTRAQSGSCEDEENIEDESSAKTTNTSSSRLRSKAPKKSFESRPKRLARPRPDSLIEPSLKSKLRRSSDKKKYL
jgi:hypothetical protein